MNTGVIILCVISVSVGLILAEKDPREVCYPVVGCFNRDPPFDNAEDSLPQSPAKLKTKFFLYTRENPDRENHLLYTEPDTIKLSNFKATRPTKIVVHGLNNNIKSPWITDMRKALIKHGDYNVIVVHWHEGARLLDYSHATANVRLVATELKVLVLLIQRVSGLNLSDVHIIGHSLGAHLAGYAGTLLRSSVGRITGLDPADPNFQHLPWMIRLDPSDADFVDVVHTDAVDFDLTSALGFGLKQPSGHVDFYPNGGFEQPGCEDGVGGLLKGVFSSISGGGSLISKAGKGTACSHSRVTQLFIESINSDCKFKAFPCESYEKFLKGECYDCGEKGCAELGLNANNNKKARGNYYLTTFKDKPYCGSNYYHVFIKYAPGQSGTKGDFELRLKGKDGTTTRSNSVMGKDYGEIGDKDISRPVVLNKSLQEIGGLESVLFRYVRREGVLSFFSRAKTEIKVASVVFKDTESGKQYTFKSKSGTIRLKDRKDSTFRVQ